MKQDETKDTPTKENDELDSKLDHEPIFSQREVESTVKGFLLAWIRGQVVINFPDAEERYARSQDVLGRQVTKKEAYDSELYEKQQFANIIEICSGRKTSTPNELATATNELFRMILMWRSGQRIKGTFLEYKIEQRMDELEEKLEATNRVVVQFINWYRGEASGEGVPKM